MGYRETGGGPVTYAMSQAAGRRRPGIAPVAPPLRSEGGSPQPDCPPPMPRRAPVPDPVTPPARSLCIEGANTEGRIASGRRRRHKNAVRNAAGRVAGRWA